MYSVNVRELEHLNLPMLPISTQYSYGFELVLHTHSRAQVLYAREGIMRVSVNNKKIVVPSKFALIIPPGMPHGVIFEGVTTQSLYIDHKYMSNIFNPYLRLLNTTPLLQELIEEAMPLDIDHLSLDRNKCLTDLILFELEKAPSVNQHFQLPNHPVLRRICLDFIRKPSICFTENFLIGKINTSLRNFSRIFKSEMGMSFESWSKKVVINYALERIKTGESITNIAMDLGYSDSNSFTTMIRKNLGYPPSFFKR